MDDSSGAGSLSRKSRHHLWAICLLGILLLNLLAACSAPVQPTALPTTPITASSPTVTPTAFPTQTSTITTTPTAKPSATTTPTPTQTRTPEITPLPTEQVQAWIKEQMKTNPSCRLPCWWGITPGKTTWIEAQAFLAPYATRIRFRELEDKFIAGVFFSIGLPKNCSHHISILALVSGEG